MSPSSVTAALLEASRKKSPAVDTSGLISSLCFDFLRLPLELRLMVYENLPLIFKYTKERDTDCRGIVIAQKRVDTAILSTCQLVHNEAAPIIQRANKKPIGTPQVIIPPIIGSWFIINYILPLFGIDEDKIWPKVLPEFKKFSNQVARAGAIEFGICVTPDTDQELFISTGLSNIMWSLDRIRDQQKAEIGDIAITICVQGLKVDRQDRKVQDIFQEAESRRIVILGMDGTPQMNWQIHWGVDDLESAWDLAVPKLVPSNPPMSGFLISCWDSTLRRAGRSWW